MQFRDYKNFKQDQYYHIYNRGVNRQQIFLDHSDYDGFIKRLAIIINRYSNYHKLNLRPYFKNEFSIIAYCLMPNHFHILIRQNTAEPISKLISKLCTSYAKYFNNKYGRVGNLFQDAFKAKILDSDAYMTYISAYIHLNPKEHSWDYQYSSLKEYIHGGTLCEKNFILKYFNNSNKDYLNYLRKVAFGKATFEE